MIDTDKVLYTLWTAPETGAMRPVNTNCHLSAKHIETGIVVTVLHKNGVSKYKQKCLADEKLEAAVADFLNQRQ